ncbi:uncharacterized protein LOC120079144 [Benincasa hispida]|uniref:uncharacterized protein LOC120079144 n=1 Tax=Benincasa hispida TaxID=102211 RepID=UPI00190250D2|nr:uncharacterized protein LOC120079144 [Benincasa hispida]
MRQRRWLELVKDYDCEILYHSRKENVMADALSRKVAHSAALITRQTNLCRELERAEIAVVVRKGDNPYLEERVRRVELGQDSEFSVSAESGLLYQGRLYVPEVSDIKDELLSEAQSSLFSIHPDSTKMYQDLKRYYWWNDMKREVAEFVSKCLVCQQVKALRLTKLAHFIPEKSTFSVDKWTQIYMKEVVRLHGVPMSIVSDRDPRFTFNFWKSLQAALGTCYQSIIGMSLFEALYGKSYRSPVCWDEVGEKRLLGPELLQTTNEVAPMKGILRFGRKGKLSPRFIGPFEVLERVGPVAYRLGLALSVIFSFIDIFHVSMLRNYRRSALPREVKTLRRREIAFGEILWPDHQFIEATLEANEDEVKGPKIPGTLKYVGRRFGVVVNRVPWGRFFKPQSSFGCLSLSVDFRLRHTCMLWNYDVKSHGIKDCLYVIDSYGVEFLNDETV